MYIDVFISYTVAFFTWLVFLGYNFVLPTHTQTQTHLPMLPSNHESSLPQTPKARADVMGGVCVLAPQTFVVCACFEATPLYFSPCVDFIPNSYFAFRVFCQTIQYSEEIITSWQTSWENLTPKLCLWKQRRISNCKVSVLSPRVLCYVQQLSCSCCARAWSFWIFVIFSIFPGALLIQNSTFRGNVFHNLLNYPCCCNGGEFLEFCRAYFGLCRCIISSRVSLASQLERFKRFACVLFGVRSRT